MEDIYNFLYNKLGYEPEYVSILSTITGGLTNRSVVFTYKDEKYILRFGTEHTMELRINRHAEYSAMQAMEENTGKVLYFDTITGNMVMEYIDGMLLSTDDLKDPIWINRIVELFTNMHSKKIKFEFDPFSDIYFRFDCCSKKDIQLPEQLSEILHKCEIIKKRLNNTKHLFYGLCHNDPFEGNLIWSKNKKIMLIDYEYAGNGDTFFDLGCLAWGYTPKLRMYLLNQYFGKNTNELYERLRDSVFVVALWNASWAMVKSDSSNSTFDYSGNAKSIFDTLSKWDDILF